MGTLSVDSMTPQASGSSAIELGGRLFQMVGTQEQKTRYQVMVPPVTGALLSELQDGMVCAHVCKKHIWKDFLQSVGFFRVFS